MPLPPNSIRLIWIPPKFPLGVPDGARHATCILVKHLTGLDIKIDLLCVLPENEPADELSAQSVLGVSSCTLVRRSASKWGPLPGSRTPWTFRSFAAPGVRRAVQTELSRLLAADHRRQTFIVFDGLHPFAALPADGLQRLMRHCFGVMYRAHNFETALWDQCARTARTPWMRWCYRQQAARVAGFEREIAQSVSFVLPVSEQDAERFRHLGRSIRTCTIPIGMDFPAAQDLQPVPKRDSFDLLFLGRLDWTPNRKGLTWFLEYIWPVLMNRRPNVSLKIAGVGDGHWLDAYARLPGIKRLGQVGQVEPLYRDSALTLAPLFQGSGTRVKILEAARYARPVLSTALGAEGSGLVSGLTYFQAETADQWLDRLETITPLECEAVGWRAFYELRDRFDARNIADRFLQMLQPPYGRPLNITYEDDYARAG